jgi:transcriptional antiterminator RfaH
MSMHWYALRSKPRKEETVWRQARARQMDTFYPRIRVQPVNPRARKIRPYFPGYLFVRADLEAVGLSTFQYMPYAFGLVCFGGEPASMSDALIYELKRRVEEIASAGGELFDGLRRGERIWIEAGPFAGYEAIFDARLPGTDRVRVLLKMMSDRHVPVELEAGWIEKAKERTPALGYRH